MSAGRAISSVLAGLVVVSGVLTTPTTPVAAEPVIQSSTVGDNDRDGINDDLEQRLANEFAPVVLMESDESNWPVNVEWFLQRARMEYHEDCFSDIDEEVVAAPIGTQDRLIGPPWQRGSHCGEDDEGYSHPPHRNITTIATDPDGQVEDGPRTTGYSDQQTFLLPDLPDSARVGSPGSARVEDLLPRLPERWRRAHAAVLASVRLQRAVRARLRQPRRRLGCHDPCAAQLRSDAEPGLVLPARR